MPRSNSVNGHDSSIRHRLDFIILPFLCIVFSLSQLDVAVFGNVAAITRDPPTSSNSSSPDSPLTHLSLAAKGFFISAIALQPLGAAFAWRVGASRWLSAVLVLWGICALLHLKARGKQLVLLRIVFGALEAGFHTTIISYLSIFYRRYEFGRRLSVLLCSSGLLGTFANIFVAAYAPRGTAVPPPLPPPAKVHSRSSFKDPWTVLFITETVIFIVLGLVASVWLPNDVDTAWFLRPESRESAKRRIYHDRQESAAETSSALSSPPPPSFPGSASPDERGDDSEDREEDSGYIEDEELDDEEVNERSRLMGGFASRGQSHPSSLNLTIASSSLTQDRGLTRSELLSGILFLPLVLPVLLLTVVSSVPTVAFPAFLSFILSSYETSSRLYGSILTVPPFVVASVVLFFVASWSDRHHQRFLPILKGFFMVVVGLISTLVISLPIFSSNHTITAPLYISLCILLAGSLVPGLLLTVWLCDNLPVPGKRALVLGIHGYTSVLSIPFYSFTYTGNENRPRLMVLVLVICSCVAASLLGIIGIRAYVVRLNIGRAKLAARYSLESENTSASDREIWLRAVQQAPRFAIIGGSWWDDNVRFFIGHKLLRLDIDQAYERRGDESVTYEYEL